MCDCLVALPARTASRRTLFGKNSDRPPGEAQVLEWVPPRTDGNTVRATYIGVAPHLLETVGAVLSRPEWMWGAEHGANEAGVSIGNATIYTTLDPRAFPPALTGMDLVRLGLERGRSAVDAVDVITSLLERYGQGGSGHEGVDRPYWSSFLVADADMAWVVETSGVTWAAEEVDAVTAISNRTTISAFDAEHRHPNQQVVDRVDPRLDGNRRFLGADVLMTVADFEEQLRTHTDDRGGWDVCMHVKDEQETTASMVAELGGRRASGRWLLGSPCRSVYVPLAVGPIGAPLDWHRWSQLDRSDPAVAEVEAGLKADFEFDSGWPDEAWDRLGRLVTGHVPSGRRPG